MVSFWSGNQKRDPKSSPTNTLNLTDPTASYSSSCSFSLPLRQFAWLHICPESATFAHSASLPVYVSSDRNSEKLHPTLTYLSLYMFSASFPSIFNFSICSVLLGVAAATARPDSEFPFHYTLPTLCLCRFLVRITGF